MNKNIIAIVLMIVGIGIYFTISSPMYDETKAISEKNDKLKEALKSVEETIKTRDEITAKYLSIPEEDRARLDKMLPSSVDNIRLVIDLNNLAQQKGLNISNLKASVPSNSAKSVVPQTTRPNVSLSSSQYVPPGSVQPNANSLMQNMNDPYLDKVQVSFTTTTSYEKFIEFMQAMESNLRVADLTHLVMSAGDDGTYNYEVQFQTYWLRQ